MKINGILKSVVFASLICFWLFSLSSCNSRRVNEIDVTSQKIDSLIEVHKINKQCILIRFGSDALTAINASKGIVVIDAGISSGLTYRYRKIIETEFHRKDFIYIINSHGHPDHYGGNSVFPEAGIIGQANCLQEIAGQWKNPAKTTRRINKIVGEYELQLQASKPNTAEWNEIFCQKTRYQHAYIDAKSLIPVKKPEITFQDSLNIDMGDVTMELFFFGKCHSNSDILIYVPGMNILFIGDLFFKYGRLSINDNLMTDKDRWRQAVIWIEKRMTPIVQIISGHGQILSTDDLKSFNSNILEQSSKK